MTDRRRLPGRCWPPPAPLGALPRRCAPRPRGARVLTATDVHVKDYPTVAGGALDRRAARARNRRPPAPAPCTTPASSAANPKRSTWRASARSTSPACIRGALNNAFPLTQRAVPALRVRFGARTCAARSTATSARACCAASRRATWSAWRSTTAARAASTTSRRPIARPADLHGLKFRVPPSDIFMPHAARCSAPTRRRWPYGEVFSGAADAPDRRRREQLRSFHSSRQFEAARYWSQSEHSYAPDVLLMSRQHASMRWQPRDRELLRRRSARASVPVMRQLWDESEAPRARTRGRRRACTSTTSTSPRSARAAHRCSREYRRDPDIDALVPARSANWPEDPMPTIPQSTPAARERPLPTRRRRGWPALAIAHRRAALLGLVVVQGWQVFARYVLNDSPSWTEPVALLLLSTAMSLGAAAGVQRGRHFGFFAAGRCAAAACARRADRMRCSAGDRRDRRGAGAAGARVLLRRRLRHPDGRRAAAAKRRSTLPLCAGRRADGAVRAASAWSPRRPRRPRAAERMTWQSRFCSACSRCCWCSACRSRSRWPRAALATLIYLGLPPIVVVQQTAAGAGSRHR